MSSSRLKSAGQAGSKEVAETWVVHLLPASLAAHPPPCPLALQTRAPECTCIFPMVKGGSSRAASVWTMLPLEVVNDPPRTGGLAWCSLLHWPWDWSSCLCVPTPVQPLEKENFDPILQRRDGGSETLSWSSSIPRRPVLQTSGQDQEADFCSA